MIEYIPYKQASEDMQSEQIHEDLKVLKKDIKKQPKESKEL